MMNELNVLIVEDEKLAANRLAKLLAEVDPNVHVIAKTTSIKESIAWLRKHQADLIFLDIQLSDGLSFSIFDEIELHTPVIFTTAYDQYAIKAFELNSVSYLLKPIRKSNLEQALHKYRSIASAFNVDIEHIVKALKGEKPEYRKRFLVSFGDKLVKINTSEIAYFFAAEKSVFIRTFQGKTYPADWTLDKLEQLLDPALFFRINRKYIIHMDAIAAMTSYSRSRVKIRLQPPADDENESIVSIDRAQKFKDWLNK